VGQAALRRAISEFMAHYHPERNHQGIENRLIQPGATLTMPSAQIHLRHRLGGMLSFYCGAIA
jgi:putative transposase